jgi:hypothetical protein
MEKIIHGNSQVAVVIIAVVAIIGSFLYFDLRDPEPPVKQFEGGYQLSGENPPAYQGSGTPEEPLIWTPSEPDETVATPPEPVMLSDEWMIREALVAKTGISRDKLTFSLGESTGWIARGTVSDEGETGDAGFFAAKDMEGAWIVTFVGQGVSTCDEVNPYGYPKDWADYCIRDGAVVLR